MKVLLHYEDDDDEKNHKSLKITLPKSWKNGPTSRLLTQFVESYNGGNKNESPALDENTLHMEMYTDASSSKSSSLLVTKKMIEIAKDAIVIEIIPDKANLYIRHGPSKTKAELAPTLPSNNTETQSTESKSKPNSNLVQCTHFGCQNRFPKGGPYPQCSYHIAPPVFHETAKFWSCCPDKKAYDWDDFQNIKGCQTGTCTEVKPDSSKKNKAFLGGCDLRELAAEKAGVKLKSIDDFNQSQLAGGSDAAPVLIRLKNVLGELGVEGELFDQVIEGIKKENEQKQVEGETWNGVAEDLGEKLKKSFKAIAVEQLRIK